MVIKSAKQPPASDPQFAEPVNVTLSTPCFYDTGDGLKASNKFYCEKIFAETVLKEIGEWCNKYHFAMVHIGCYNARKARHADGTPIMPSRWSNHAYGLAIDFKGVKDIAGKFISVHELQDDSPAKWKELITNITASILASHHKPEILVEGQWCHLGIWKHS